MAATINRRLGELPVNFSEHFWCSDKITQRSRQQGLQYAVEGYVHKITLKNDLNNEFLTIEARCYRSQRKREKPHFLFAQQKTTDNSFVDQQCSCIAGYNTHLNKP